jgi:RNAse (barnase) inhibitor barstar
MPVFRNTPEDWQRLDLSLLQNGACHLYLRTSILDEDTRWLEQHGYKVYRFDCSHWARSAGERQMHEDLARELHFPDYYGRNLDALNDCVGDCCDADALVTLRLEHFDAFFGAHPSVAHALLDIVADNSRLVALWGARLIALVQSDVPNLELPTVGATAVSWNPREFMVASRKQPTR